MNSRVCSQNGLIKKPDKMHEPQPATAPAPSTAGQAPLLRWGTAPPTPTQDCVAHTCAQTLVCVNARVRRLAGASAHTPHTQAQAYPPSWRDAHRAGTPWWPRQLPWEPGPASWVNTRLGLNPAFPSHTLQMEDFREGMSVEPACSWAGQARPQSKGTHGSEEREVVGEDQDLWAHLGSWSQGHRWLLKVLDEAHCPAPA